jgi:hypothetical protein
MAIFLLGVVIVVIGRPVVDVIASQHLPAEIYKDLIDICYR